MAITQEKPKTGLLLPPKENGLILPPIEDTNGLVLPPVDKEPYKIDSSLFGGALAAKQTIQYNIPSSVAAAGVTEIRSRTGTIDYLKLLKDKGDKRVENVNTESAYRLKGAVDDIYDEKTEAQNRLDELKRVLEAGTKAGMRGEAVDRNKADLLSKIGLATEELKAIEGQEEARVEAWNAYMEPVMDDTSKAANELLTFSQDWAMKGEERIGKHLKMTTDDVKEITDWTDWAITNVGSAMPYSAMSAIGGGMGMIRVEQGSIEGDIITRLMQETGLPLKEILDKGIDQKGADLARENGAWAGVVEFAGDYATILIPWIPLGLKAGTKIPKIAFYKLVDKTMRVGGKMLLAATDEAFIEGEQTRIELMTTLKALGYSDSEISKMVTWKELKQPRLSGFIASWGLSTPSAATKLFVDNATARHEKTQSVKQDEIFTQEEKEVTSEESRKGVVEIKEEIDRLAKDINKETPSVAQKEAVSIVETHNKEGGSSISQSGVNLFGEEGFSVSPYPELTVKIKGKEITDEQLSYFKEENKEVLALEENFVGTWFNKDDGFSYIDVSIYEKDLEKALRIGREKNQITIFDLKNQKIIPTEGTGKKTGQQNAEFFTGKAEKASSDVVYKPVLKIDDSTPVAKAYDLYSAGGNFTGHISKMIAGFAEKQIRVAEAIVKGDFENFLDIGTSEGGMIKTVAANSGTKAVGIDPNAQMQENFNSTPNVEGAEYKLEAFEASWVEEDGTKIKKFTTKVKFDIINEDFAFQFINNDRKSQVEAVKGMMTNDGVFVTSEKFHTANQKENEARKYEHQKQYFNESELTEDKQTIVSGMDNDMVNDVDYFSTLKDNFNYVVEFWNAGNFKGYVASNSKEKLNQFIDNVGDLSSEYSDTKSLTSTEALKPTEGLSDSQLSKAKDKLAGGLEMLARVTGVTKNIVPVEGDSMEAAIKQIGEGLIDLGIATIENVAQKIKEHLKEQGIAYKDADIDKVYQIKKTPVKEKTGKTVKPKTVKKTIVTERAYEGDFDYKIKKALEKVGLTRTVKNQEEAELYAKEFVKEVGYDAALEAVRDDKVKGDIAAAVWADLIETLGNRVVVEKDAGKAEILANQVAELINELGLKATTGGQFSSMLKRMYWSSDLGWNEKRKSAEYKKWNDGKIPAEVVSHFKKVEKELISLRRQLIEAEKEIEKKSDSEALSDILEAIDRNKNDKKSVPEKALDAIGKMRANIKAYAYSDIGIVAIIDTGLAVIEVAIKSGVKAAEAIEHGIKYIKDKLKEHGNKKWEAEDKFRKDALKTFSKEKKVRQAEIKEDGSLTIPDSLIMSLVEQGFNKIETLTGELQRILGGEGIKATEREVRDAISGYGKRLNPPKQGLYAEVRRMRRIGKILSGLEDVRKGKRPKRSGRKRDSTNPEERGYMKQLREEIKLLPVDSNLREELQKTLYDVKKQRLNNQIEDLQREIDNKKQIKRNVNKIKDDAEILELIAERDAIKAEHDAMFKDDKYKEEKRLQTTKKNAERILKDLVDRYKKGDFSKKKKPPPLLADNELIDIRAKIFVAREKMDRKIYELKLKNRGLGERSGDFFISGYQMARVTAATFEFSFMLIQGLNLTTAYPKYAGKATANMMSAFGSEKRSEDILNKIKAQDWYPEAKQSGLGITETRGDITVREELTNSDWANALWNIAIFPSRLAGKKAFEAFKKATPFKLFERAASGYLNTLRVMAWLEGRRALLAQGITFQNNPQAYKQMTDVVNVFSSRPKLGALEQIAKPLSYALFSPKNTAAALIVANPLVAPYYFGRMRAGAEKFKPSVAQKMAGRIYLASVGFAGIVTFMAAMFLNNDDDDDTGVDFSEPTSTDWLAIKVSKNTRLDLWGGKKTTAIFINRLIFGEVFKDDKIMPLGLRNETPTRADLIGRYVVGKFHPSAGIGYRYYDRNEDEFGNVTDAWGVPYSLGGDILETLPPIVIGTFGDLKDDMGITPFTSLLFLWGFAGGGINTYGETTKKGVEQEMLKRALREERERQGKKKVSTMKTSQEKRREKEDERRLELLRMKVAKRYKIKYIKPK